MQRPRTATLNSASYGWLFSDFTAAFIWFFLFFIILCNLDVSGSIRGFCYDATLQCISNKKVLLLVPVAFLHFSNVQTGHWQFLTAGIIGIFGI